MKTFEPNDIGLSSTSSWDSDPRGDGLRGQLKAEGVPFREAEVPNIAGWAGCAFLVFYTSPRSGKPVTVLATPYMIGPDAWGETYYNFSGMDEQAARVTAAAAVAAVRIMWKLLVAWVWVLRRRKWRRPLYAGSGRVDSAEEAGVRCAYRQPTKADNYS